MANKTENLPADQQAKNKNYDALVQQKMPKRPMLPGLFKAFLVGGIICSIGQFVMFTGKEYLGLDKEGVSAYTAIIMVFLGATLTGIGIYDRIGKFAGAGSVVPITGFANSIVAPAMEFRREGLVLGVGAKLFSIAGPVLVYGIGTSIIVGLLSLLAQFFA
nr:stage V sporulation protein AC [Maliibacterium massiliense]